MYNEMKELCSLNHNSLLRSDHEAIKHFSWVAIFEELIKKVPTLVKFIQKLLPSSSNILISALICIMVKQRCKHMSLFQRVISELLYGHGTSQQVNEGLQIAQLMCLYRYYQYLHPFMICMSPAATVGIITKLSNHYDERLLHWVNELKMVCLL